jgi:hypothetical protein
MRDHAFEASEATETKTDSYFIASVRAAEL